MKLIVSLRGLHKSVFQSDGWMRHIRTVLDVFATDWRTSSLASFTDIFARCAFSQEHLLGAQARWKWIGLKTSLTEKKLSINLQSGEGQWVWGGN